MPESGTQSSGIETVAFTSRFNTRHLFPMSSTVGQPITCKAGTYQFRSLLCRYRRIEGEDMKFGLRISSGLLQQGKMRYRSSSHVTV